MNGKNVLILGASGFIGKEVLKALKENPAIASVSVLVHKKHVQLKGVTTYHGSLETMNWSVFDAGPPSHIIHLARINSRRFGALGRLWAAYKGRKANQRLIRHIQKKGWNTVITYVSGSLLYGDNGNEPVTEDHPLRPVSFARQYSLAESPWLNCGLPVNIVRVPWVLGRDSWFGGFYLASIKNKKEVPCYGKGDNLMSFIEVGDAGRMIAWTALNRNGGTLHLAMPRAHSQMELCLTLSGISGYPVHEIGLNGYEKALQEAFTSSIRLETKYPGLVPEELMHFKDLRSLLEAQLPLFLKDE